MSSPSVNPRQQKPQEVDWARMIPGDTPVLRTGRKKPVQSIRWASQKAPEIAAGAGARAARNGLALLIPAPLQGRMAWKWMCSTAADFALVGLNWLLIGAALVPLRVLFPEVRLFEYKAGAPASLLGIAVLHALLISLMGSVEGVQVGHRDMRGQARAIGKAILWATIALCLSYGLQGASWATGGLFCGAGLLHFGALWTWRWQLARPDRLRRDSGDMRNVLIVGAGGVGRRVASYLEEHPEAGRTISGFLDNERPLGNGVIGRVSELARLARTGFVDEVILAAPHDRELIQQVLRESRRLRLDLEIVPELFGCKPAENVERIGDLLVLSLNAEQSPAAGLALKRVVDVMGAGLALALLSPTLAVIAGLIKLDSPGPVLYRAHRAGRKGRLFRCYKFRTMVSNADALKEPLRRNNQRSGPFFKIAGDPRMTRLGRFLRHYSLDELPQLWNVLKGDMSLVGPRPHPLDDVAGYEIEDLARLDVMPGITGLWQVTARRDPSFQRSMALDREYIRTWSLGSDMRILLRTFLAVVRGNGD